MDISVKQTTIIPSFDSFYFKFIVRSSEKSQRNCENLQLYWEETEKSSDSLCENLHNLLQNMAFFAVTYSTLNCKNLWQKSPPLTLKIYQHYLDSEH